MRRSIVRFTTPIGKTAGLLTAPFSSGAGRGRGRGAGVDPFSSFVKTAPGQPINDGNNVSGRGNGRGGGEIRVPGGRVDDFVSDDLTRPDPREFGRKVPEFIHRMEEEKVGEAFESNDIVVNRRKGGDEENVRFGLVDVLTGTGRGTVEGGGGARGIGVKQQENRFIRARQENVGTGENANVRVRTPGKKFDNPEDSEDDDDDDDDRSFLGDPADGEKLARKLGPETMNQLVEGFEEISENVLPSVQQEAFIEAMHINNAIECEPEYLFGDFESNPDIDEKPPMTLRECFDKAKPFLMAYENIQSHEEWEEAMEDAMKQVPLMKQIVDYYSGPNRVTAKKQMEELERVAKTLPEIAPDSVKRFTNRAVLSLQSNPGLGFDKKCQFMDKLVWEVSQQHK